jgi:hypothetical protein
MGIDLNSAPENFRAKVQGLKVISPRRPRFEREEQRLFANWCLLHGLPFCWHATHSRTKATVGVFDFWVGHCGRGAWLEFKRDLGAKLTPEQDAFMMKLSRENAEWHVVTSAAQAIEIVKRWEQKL